MMSMTSEKNGQSAIIRTERGLTIAKTRITLYDVIDYLKAEYPPKFIGSILNLKADQLKAALSYIDANHAEVEAEYQVVLKEAEETRQYWEERNHEIFAKIANMPPPPGREAIWEKLKAQKAKHQATFES